MYMRQTFLTNMVAVLHLINRVSLKVQVIYSFKPCR